MEYKEIQNIAKLKGLVHVNLFKTELIKAIQTNSNQRRELRLLLDRSQRQM